MEVLFVFLKWVASFAHLDEETGSKMDLGNLATVICPSILKARSKDAARDESFGAIRVITALLENQDEFYVVPEEFLPILHDQEYFASSVDLPSKEFLKKCELYMRLKASGRNPALMSPTIPPSFGSSNSGNLSAISRTVDGQDGRPIPRQVAFKQTDEIVLTALTDTCSRGLRMETGRHWARLLHQRATCGTSSLIGDSNRHSLHHWRTPRCRIQRPETAVRLGPRLAWTQCWRRRMTGGRRRGCHLSSRRRGQALPTGAHGRARSISTRSTAMDTLCSYGSVHDTFSASVVVSFPSLGCFPLRSFFSSRPHCIRYRISVLHHTQPFISTIRTTCRMTSRYPGLPPDCVRQIEMLSTLQWQTWAVYGYHPKGVRRIDSCNRSPNSRPTD